MQRQNPNATRQNNMVPETKDKHLPADVDLRALLAHRRMKRGIDIINLHANLLKVMNMKQKIKVD